MLQNISVQNIAGIKKLYCEFNKGGLITITGETGSGKSVFLSAIALALGARGSSKIIRHGEEKAQVIANFTPHKSNEVWEILESADIDASHDEGILLRRSISSDGRSKAFINDQSVSLGLLSKVGGAMVDIYGQFAAQELLSSSTHRLLLDDYIGQNKISDFNIKELWLEMKNSKDALFELQNQTAQSKENKEALEADLDNLNALEPAKGEEETLLQRKTMLMNSGRALEALSVAINCIDSDENPINKAAGEISRNVDVLGEKGAAALDSLESANAEVQAARGIIGDILQEIDASDSSLEEVDERLHALRSAARRHGCSVDGLEEIRLKIEGQLSSISNEGDSLNAAIERLNNAKSNYSKAAKSLSEHRKNAARKLQGEIKGELVPLHLSHAKFLVEILELPEDRWGEFGIDSVRFLVAVGGENSKFMPIDKIASGGEAARFMLAIRAVMARCGAPKMIIFDEVDASIGGAVADAVGSRLLRLASQHQLLVITHAPQVASKATQHFVVKKGADNATELQKFTTLEEKQNEIARMLSGSEVTKEAIAQAGKLLRQS